MKKIIPILLIIALIALSLPVVSLAESASCGDSCTYTLDSEGKLIISGSGKINDRAFELNNKIKSVEICEGITEIGKYALANCIFTEVKIAASVKTIDSGAFAYSANIKTVTFAENSVLETIDEEAFCAINPTELVIPASVQTIGKGAFGGFYDPTIVTFLGCPANIHAEAFSYTTARVVIPDGVLWTYGTSSFGGTLYYPTVTVEDGVRYCAFEDGFMSIAKDGGNTGGTAEIKADKFNGKTNITGISIGEGITAIGDRAFAGTGFKELVIPASVRTIGSEVFKNCTRIKKVTFLGCPTSISNTAFANVGAFNIVLADHENWIHSDKSFGGRPTYYKANGKTPYTGSVLSEGNIWIIVGIAAAVIAVVAAFVVVKKKKKPALASGENADEE